MTLLKPEGTDYKGDGLIIFNSHRVVKGAQVPGGPTLGVSGQATAAAAMQAASPTGVDAVIAAPAVAVGGVAVAAKGLSDDASVSLGGLSSSVKGITGDVSASLDKTVGSINAAASDLGASVSGVAGDLSASVKGVGASVSRLHVSITMRIDTKPSSLETKPT
jgi:uncharacterized protein YoxC